MVLPSQDPRPTDMPRAMCPRCGAVGRRKSFACNITATASVTASAQLIIGWQEVDRLAAEAEYAAALLIAAVNVEFVLWERLRRFTPRVPPSDDASSEKRTWERVANGRRDDVGLGSLIQLALFFVDAEQLDLAPTLRQFGWPLNDARKGIAHTRGFFARLTRLEDPDWPETRIRQVLESAKEFCHGNAP